MKRTFAYLLSILCALPIYAGQTKSNLTIEHLRVRKSVAYIKFSECSYYSRVYLNSEYEKLMYSVVTAAALANKRVSVEFNGDDCSKKELELVYIDVLTV